MNKKGGSNISGTTLTNTHACKHLPQKYHYTHCTIDSDKKLTFPKEISQFLCNRHSETVKRNSHIGFRKPNSKIGVLKTKTEHRGMKNEIQQVGYFKRKLIGGVLRTKTQSRGTTIQSNGKGQLKRGFEIRYIILSQFKRGVSDFVSKRKNTLPNLETLKSDGRMSQKRYPRVQEGMFPSQIKKEVRYRNPFFVSHQPPSSRCVLISWCLLQSG